MILVLGEPASTPAPPPQTPSIAEQHQDHAWRQVGRCVYCECGERLFQGTVPPGHKTFTPSKKRSPSEEMLARWGKL